MSYAGKVKDFYSNLKFPGPYSLEDFSYYQKGYSNEFINVYEKGVQDKAFVLDVGCGTGFITNYLAYMYPRTKFVGVDFSDSIDYAQSFSKKYKLKNVSYYKQDFLNFNQGPYDCIISNGVLHHIPEYETAMLNIKNMLTDDGKLILGVYNTYGKLAKKFITVKYKTEMLRKDQEEVPFEISFSNGEFLRYFSKFNVDKIYPSLDNRFVNARNLLNYKNGGLTIYRLDRKQYD